MVVYFILVSVIFPGNIIGKKSRSVRQVTILWCLSIWGMNTCFLRTDYLTSMWRPIVLITVYFAASMALHTLVMTPLVYRILMFISVAIQIEVVQYRGLYEQARLFLKSEVFKR